MLFLFIYFFAIRGPLTVVASPVVEHRLQTRRLSDHGSRAQPLRGMRDLPGSGHEPVSRWQADSQPLHHQGSPMDFIFNIESIGLSWWHSG